MHFRCRGNPLEKNSFFNFSATKWKDCQKEKCKRFGVVAGQLRHFDGSDVPRSRKKKKKKKEEEEEGISVKDYADVPRVPYPDYTSSRGDVPRV